MKTLYKHLKYHCIVYIFLGVLLVAFGCGSEQHTDEIYVAAMGDDNAEGSIAEPLATISAAVQKVRSIRKSGNSGPMTIYLRGGRHYLNETLVLGIADGSAPSTDDNKAEETNTDQLSEAYLTFAAYPNEKPIISAGVPVNGWQLVQAHSELPEEAVGKVWVADIPDAIDKFYTLYDEKGRLNRARTEGFIPTKMGDKRTVYFPKGKIKNWENLADVELNIRPSRAWMINMLPLEMVDEENGMATTKVSSTYPMGELAHWVHKRDGNSAWIENTLEALDVPGEWVVNSKTRKIYLWPTSTEKDGSPKGILAPTTSELIRVEGKIDYKGAIDQPVRGVSFSGITFSHADRRAWTTDDDQLGWGLQHDWDMFDRPTAALRFRGAEDCLVMNCKFINSGGSGLRFDLHAQQNKVADCEFTHLGEAGILLAGYGPGTKDVNHHNEIINNHIHHFSEITWHSPGIWAWQSGHNRIANNYIHHSGYAGILITNRISPDRSINGEGGRTVRHDEISSDVMTPSNERYADWKLREKYNHSRHNIVEYNEITHAVQLLSDGNCIYVSGAGTGNIIRYNYLHDNLEHSMPAPIRCDDEQHETLIFGNVLYNNYAFAAGIASKGVNDIINNVIAGPLVAPRLGYISFEWVPVTGSTVQKNIVISNPDGGNAYAERPKKDQIDYLPNLLEIKMDSNLYYNPVDKHWMDDHFSRTHKVGLEEASLFADPMFLDMKNGNFGFKEGSPALKLNIEPIDVSKMGLKKENEIKK